MKLYKYRDFSDPSDIAFERLEPILHRREFWGARPADLNDPEEFVWTCDYTRTADTLDLLTELLIQTHGRTHDVAQERAARYVEAGRLKAWAQATVPVMIQQCRNDLGLVCFGTSPDNDILWELYGGHGAGVCIELDAPENLLGAKLHHVQYSDAKIIHIDQLIRACLDPTHVNEVYTLALLTKPCSWAAEAEIRFVSQMQKVPVVIPGSHITRLILGDALTPSVRQRIQVMAGAIPLASRTR